MTNSTLADHEQNLPARADPSTVGAFEYEYVFPAIRGVQAGREFFISMCPLRLIPKLFLFDEDELVAELRAQRVLNKGRLPELSRYILDNPDSYVFSALTASIDDQPPSRQPPGPRLRFESSSQDARGERVGLLCVPMTARFVINDGQHRRAAIELALKERPKLADESIAVVFFVDAGLKRSQQMFADLNRHAVRPSPSIGILYDHRDEDAAIVREMVLTSKVFRGLIEMERTTLGVRSRKLFTLSGLYSGTCALLRGRCTDRGQAVEQAREFWEACADVIPDWHAVRERRASAGELRREYIHSHGIALQALGMAGNHLLQRGGDFSPLEGLRDLDWSRLNVALWEGRALVGGRVSRSSANVILTANVFMERLGLELPHEHAQAETAFLSARSAT